MEAIRIVAPTPFRAAGSMNTLHIKNISRDVFLIFSNCYFNLFFKANFAVYIFSSVPGSYIVVEEAFKMLRSGCTEIIHIIFNVSFFLII